MSKMSNITNIDKFKDDDYKERTIKKWESAYSGCVILRDDYDTEEELESDWEKFSQMPHSLQLDSDDQAIKLYGITNEEKYFEIKSKFLKQNLKPENITIYRPSSISELKETTFNESSLLESVENSSDFIYKSIMYESIKNKNIISEEAEEKVKNELYKNIRPTISISIRGFFLPSELENLGTSFSDNIEPMFSLKTPKSLLSSIINDNLRNKDMYMSYKMKTLGITPSIRGFDNIYDKVVYTLYNKSKNSNLLEEKLQINQQLLDIGWNPYIPYNESTKYKRIKTLMENKGYSFIDLTESNEEFLKSIPINKEFNNNYLYLMYLFKQDNENEQNNSYVPTVVIGNTNNQFWVFNKYNFVRKYDINQFKESIYQEYKLEIYAISLDENLINKIETKLNYMSSNMTKFSHNYLYDILCYKGDNLDINNTKLFSEYLYNFLLELSKCNLYSPTSIRLYPRITMFNTNEKPNILYLYYGKVIDIDKIKNITPSRMELESCSFINSVISPIQESNIISECDGILYSDNKSEKWDFINNLLN